MSGLFLGLGLIVAIGSQNAFVIRQGIKKEHHLPIALFGAIADAFLIGLGVLGLGAFIQSQAWLLNIAKWGGFAFLIWFGFSSLKKAFTSNEALHLEKGEAKQVSLKKSLATMAAFTFLNPHVYLDTVISLGLISTQFYGINLFLFFLGAASASFIWFFSLSFFSARLSHILDTPKTWKIINILIALLMFLIAYQLIFLHY